MVFHCCPEGLPPILNMRDLTPMSSCSKASRGLFVQPRVKSIFTRVEISPSTSSRQFSSRYAIRAGRNLPDKEFRFSFPLRRTISSSRQNREYGVWSLRIPATDYWTRICTDILYPCYLWKKSVVVFPADCQKFQNTKFLVAEASGFPLRMKTINLKLGQSMI